MTKRRQRGRLVNVETVVRLCAERNWRRTDLVKASGIARSTIDKIWAGEGLDDHSITQIAGALGVRCEDLLYDQSIHTPQRSANGNAIVPYRRATAPDVQPSDARMELNFRYSTISLSIRDDAATPATIKKLFLLLEESMIKYEEYKSQEEDSVRIMLVIGTDPKHRRIFAYIGFLTSRQDDVLECINRQRDLREVSIVIESGRGEPSPEIKAKMEKDYLFDHEAAEHL